MYGLASTTDFSFLVGATLIQVCFGENELILRFDSGTSILIEGDFRVGTTEQVEYSSPAPAASPITALLGEQVREYRISDDSELELEFANGIRVTLADSSREYESYQVTHGGDTWVI